MSMEGLSQLRKQLVLMPSGVSDAAAASNQPAQQTNHARSLLLMSWMVQDSLCLQGCLIWKFRIAHSGTIFILPTALQGPFTPAEMVDWCLNELLPIHLLVYPGQQDEPGPSSADMFWPLNELICYAAQSRAAALAEPSPPLTATQQAGHPGAEDLVTAAMVPTDTTGQLTAVAAPDVPAAVLATPGIPAAVAPAPAAVQPTQPAGEPNAAAAAVVAAGGALRAVAASAPVQPAQVQSTAHSLPQAATAAAAAGPSSTTALKRSVNVNAKPFELAKNNLWTAPACTSAVVEQAGSSSASTSQAELKPIGDSYSPLRASASREAASAGAGTGSDTAKQAAALTAGAADVIAADTSTQPKFSKRLRLNCECCAFHAWHKGKQQCRNNTNSSDAYCR